MFPVLLHVMTLIYATSAWNGKFLYKPVVSAIIWCIISVLFLFFILPVIVKRKTDTYGNYLNDTLATIEAEKKVPDFIRLICYLSIYVYSFITPKYNLTSHIYLQFFLQQFQRM